MLVNDHGLRDEACEEDLEGKVETSRVWMPLVSSAGVGVS